MVQFRNILRSGEGKIKVRKKLIIHEIFSYDIIVLKAISRKVSTLNDSHSL